MNRRTPIQVVILRSGGFAQTQLYELAIRDALSGTGLAGDPGHQRISWRFRVPIVAPVNGDPSGLFEKIVARAKKMIVVSIFSSEVDRSLDGLHKKLVAHADELLAVVMPRLHRGSEYQQSVTAADSIEPSFHRTAVALAVMELCRRQLLIALFGELKLDERSRLFISHAKTDGISLSQAIASLLSRMRKLPGLEDSFQYFYDAESILPGEKWEESLERSSMTSLFLALRTEAYDSRYWCRREYRLAERHGAVILVVDLRRRMVSRPSVLPIEYAPSVRVSDGNVWRVIFHALLRHIEHLVNLARVNPGVNQLLLPRFPTPDSISGALERLSNSRGNTGKGRPGQPARSQSEKGREQIIYCAEGLDAATRESIKHLVDEQAAEIVSIHEWEYRSARGR